MVIYTPSLSFLLKTFMQSFHTNRRRFTIRSQVTYIYIWEVWYASDKMKAVTRKGRHRMNLSWKSKWQRRGEKGGSREVVEWPFFSRSPEVCRCRRKEKDDREIKVDTDGSLYDGGREREREMEFQRTSSLLHLWLLILLPSVWTGNFEARHSLLIKNVKFSAFRKNFHNFCIGRKFTEWKRGSLIPPKCSLPTTCFSASREREGLSQPRLEGESVKE